MRIGVEYSLTCFCGRCSHHSPGCSTNRFVVERGLRRVSHFVCFVDHDRVSWTTYRDGCHKFPSEQAAQDTLIEIRRRAELRRGGK